MVKEIPLQNGTVALVDDEDYERCMEHIWSISSSRGVNLRVTANTGEGIVILSRFILKIVEDKKVVTFSDKNTLNCQKKNLIVVDRQNNAIRRKSFKNSSSKYKGVPWDKRSDKWVASTRVGGKRKHLGYFSDEDEAAVFYNKAALEYFGEDAYQNVIGEDNRTEFKEIEKTNQRRSRNKTGYKGVAFSGRKFIASITQNYKFIYLGNFDTSEEAAKAYDKKAYELYGDKAILNFPERVQECKEWLK